MKTSIVLGHRTDDATAVITVSRPKTPGYHNWTDAEIAQFEAQHPIDSKARLAFALLLYTGQRRSDVLGLGRQHVRFGRIHLHQQKTGAELGIKILPKLQEVLDAHPPRNLTFLVTGFGKPFSRAGFGNWFKEQIREAGLPEHCAVHGLRKALVRRLAEAGQSASRIMAVTGHQSLKEVEIYVRAAAQLRLADAALEALVETEEEQKLAQA